MGGAQRIHCDSLEGFADEGHGHHLRLGMTLGLAALAHFRGAAIGGYVRDSWPVIALKDTLPGLLDAEMPCKWDVMSKPQHNTPTAHNPDMPRACPFWPPQPMKQSLPVHDTVVPLPDLWSTAGPSPG